MLAHHNVALILADVIIFTNFCQCPCRGAQQPVLYLEKATQVVAAAASTTTSTKLKIRICHAFMEGFPMKGDATLAKDDAAFITIILFAINTWSS